MSAMYTTDGEIVLRRLESECLLTLRLSATGVPGRLPYGFGLFCYMGISKKQKARAVKISLRRRRINGCSQ